ncbi:MAG: succinyl-diaminopimelate desuccinylase [Alphaproteobacteria bacterium]|nr:succinyl-diaminopimelate desuccinylase [Alphaproteobacteria bacterium]
MTASADLTALSEPLALAQALIRRPSVTPKDEGALDVLSAALTTLGFECHRQVYADDGGAPVDNLYARLGTAGPNFCFAGHTDVVPVGTGWTMTPFDATIRDGILYGRGASDMKAAIAAFVAAVARHLKAGAPKGSISLLITGDEEGDAVNGTKKVLAWLNARGEKLDACLVGEPTSAKVLGDTIKIGRRGSLTAKLKVFGTQGHSAYPHLADNPIPRLMKMLAAITDPPLDSGSAHFQPSTVAITTVDVGNTATNLIPAEATAGFNIRFNDLHSSGSLRTWLTETFDRLGGVGSYDLAVKVSGESFLTPPGPLSALVADAVKDITSRPAELSTSGGTSDARFIKDACPVVELGMVGLTMHKANEQCSIADLSALTSIYQRVLDRFFARA